MNIPSQSFDTQLWGKCFVLNFTTISVDLKDEGNQSIQIKTLAYKTSNLEAKKGIISKST